MVMVCAVNVFGENDTLKRKLKAMWQRSQSVHCCNNINANMSMTNHILNLATKMLPL